MRGVGWAEYVKVAEGCETAKDGGNQRGGVEKVKVEGEDKEMAESQPREGGFTCGRRLRELRRRG